MSTFFLSFKKQGGIKLLKNYCLAGVLSYSLGQLILTGRSPKSLEILRLGVQMKIRNKLQKKFIHVLKQFDMDYLRQAQPSKPSNKIWICWMQGMENAPALVQKCYESIKTHLKDREIILITSQNRKDYVTMPEYIEEKYSKGIITHTHFSDLLRTELLCKYGGTWMDCTVFCSGRNIPQYFFDSPFFIFQNLKPGADGATCNTSSWFVTSWSNHKFILAQRALLFEYWKNYNYIIDYFLFHHFISIISEFYAEDWTKIIQFPNSFPHVLQLMMFEPFEQEKWNAITESCPFHKLTYKHNMNKLPIKNTYYQHVMDSYS